MRLRKAEVCADILKRGGAVRPPAWFKRNGIRKSLYRKLCAVFAAVILAAFVLITLTSGIISRKIAQENAVNASELLLKSLNDSLGFLLSDCENISRSVLNNDSVQRYLTAGASGEGLQALKLSARSELVNLCIFRSAVESIIVFNDQGRLVSVGTSPSYVVEAIARSDSDWAREASAQSGMFFWTSAELARGQSRVFLTRVINKKNSRTPVGTLLIALDNDVLGALVNSLGEEGMSGFYVYGAGGTPLFSDAGGEFQQAMDAFYAKGAASGSIDSHRGAGYLIVTRAMAHTGWTLCRLVKASGVLKEFQANLSVVVVVGLACTLAAFAIFSLVARGITSAISGLIQSMKRAEKTDFKTELPVTREDEVGALTGEYNMFIRKINFLVNEVYQVKLHAREAEIASLQAQINPHFLYNTLNCISWKALERHQAEISQMVVALSKMFRFSLSGGDIDVALRQEMDNVDDYLFLQKMRFEERLKVYMDIPDELYQVRLPKYTVQPIVENCVIHGLGEFAPDGCIWITASEAGDDVVIDVTDNGAGADPEQMARILSGEEPPRKGHGHGVRNVNERLKLLYGAQYGLTYLRPEAGGTRVRIRLPRRVQ
jgi:two-component system sensor histidine kinase YesM